VAASNYFDPVPETGFSHNGIVKFDHSFNNNNRLSFRYFVGQGTQIAPVGSRIPYYYQVGPMHVQNYSLTYNTIFSTRLTNQALVGVSYFNQVFSDVNSNIDPVALGLNTGVTSPNLRGAPLISISGFENTGLTPNSGRNDITGHFSDALSYTTGSTRCALAVKFARRASILSIPPAAAAPSLSPASKGLGACCSMTPPSIPIS